MITVLITGCSKFSKEIIECLKNNEYGEEFTIIGIDCNENNLLKNSVDYPMVVPGIYHEEYIPTLFQICAEYNVDVVLPFITAELPMLSRIKGEFAKKGTSISVASPEALDVVNDKMNLYHQFSRYMPEQIEVNTVSDAEAFIRMHYTTGVCCKISDGCGGAGFAVIDDKKAHDMRLFNKFGHPVYITRHFLYELIESADKPIILQQFLHGTDYSTCALAGKDGMLKGICGFSGYGMDRGAITGGRIERNDEAYAIHREVIEKTVLEGNSCADFIVCNGRPYLLEINPRLSASLPFVSHAGANFVYERVADLVYGNGKTDYDIHYGLEMRRYYGTYYI